jgi:glutamate 5-kinase
MKTARFMLMSYRRVVAKFGTSLLTSGTDHLDLQVMSSLVEQIARLHRQGKEIVIISSGAIASGRQKLKKVARTLLLNRSWLRWAKATSCIPMNNFSASMI